MRTVCCCLLVVVVGCSGTSSGPRRPTADVEGQTWTLDDMVAHLQKNGLKDKVYRAVPDADGDPGVWLINEVAYERNYGRELKFTPPDSPFTIAMLLGHETYVGLKKSDKDARAIAGRKWHMFGGFSWGRFAFAGYLNEDVRRRALP